MLIMNTYFRACSYQKVLFNINLLCLGYVAYPDAYTLVKTSLEGKRAHKK